MFKNVDFTFEKGCLDFISEDGIVREPSRDVTIEQIRAEMRRLGYVEGKRFAADTTEIYKFTGKPKVEPKYIGVTIVTRGRCKGQNQSDLTKRQAYGSYAVIVDGVVKKIKKFELPKASTSVEAQWQSVIKAIRYARDLHNRLEHTQLVQLTLETDAENVIDIIKGEKKAKSPNIVTMKQQADLAMDGWKIKYDSLITIPAFKKIDKDRVTEVLGK